MKRIALVNPQLGSRGWGSGLRPSTWDDIVPRHGLCALSAVLKRAGHDVRMVDLRMLASWEAFERTLIALEPDLVGVTAHTIEAPVALECLTRAKAALPTAVTVAGGIHFTMLPEQAVPVADRIVRGEAEEVFSALAAAPERWPKVCWGEPPNLDGLPLEDRELYPDHRWRTHFPLWDLRTPIVEVLTGRGCPFSCRFCCGPGERNLYSRAAAGDPTARIPACRRRSVAHVMAELETLQMRYGFSSIVFHDDQFLLDPAWVEEFCTAMTSAGFGKRGVRWWAACRADLICRYPQLIAAMARAGLHIISIGFESFSDPLLDWLGKGTSRAQNVEAARICNRLGLDIYANLMFGVPREDGVWHPEDDAASLEALEEVRPRYFSPAFFSPVPGSWLYDWAIAEGLVDPLDAVRGGHRNPRDGRLPGIDYPLLQTLVSRAGRDFARPWYDRVRLRRFRLRRPGLAPAVRG